MSFEALANINHLRGHIIDGICASTARFISSPPFHRDSFEEMGGSDCVSVYLIVQPLLA